jgi:hypothetical protein
VGTKHMDVRTKIYVCRNKHQFAYENKSMVVGTKTYGCKNKKKILGKKSMVGERNHRLWE